MIQVETDRPVYSNATGNLKERAKKILSSDPEKKSSRVAKRDERKTTRVAKREERKARRIAKRNATKLKKVNTPKGSKFTFKLKKLNKQGTKRTKKHANGTVVVIKESDVVTTPQGDFDKIEVAKALNVTPEQVTPELVKQNQVVEASGDVSIIVPDNNVATDDAGDPYLAEDLQDANETLKDVADEENSKRKMTKTEKILLFGGIGVTVLILGVVLYRKFSNKGK